MISGKVGTRCQVVRVNFIVVIGNDIIIRGCNKCGKYKIIPCDIVLPLTKNNAQIAALCKIAGISCVSGKIGKHETDVEFAKQMAEMFEGVRNE